MAVLRVIEAFADFRKGHPEIYNPGQLVDASNPVVKGREANFEPVEVAAARASVESATAGPGEKRSVSKPRKAAASKQES